MTAAGGTDQTVLSAVGVFALLAGSVLAGCLGPAPSPSGGLPGGDSAAVTHGSQDWVRLKIRVDDADALYDEGAEVTFRYRYRDGMIYNGSTLTAFRGGFGLVKIDGSGTAQLHGNLIKTAQIHPGESWNISTTVTADGPGTWRIHGFAVTPPPSRMAALHDPDVPLTLSGGLPIFLQGDGSDARARQGLPGETYGPLMPRYLDTFERVGSGPVAVNETVTVRLTLNASHRAPRTVLVAEPGRNLELVDGQAGRIVDLPSGTSTFEWTVRVVDDQYGTGQIEVLWLADCRVKCGNGEPWVQFPIAS